MPISLGQGAAKKLNDDLKEIENKVEDVFSTEYSITDLIKWANSYTNNYNDSNKVMNDKMNEISRMMSLIIKYMKDIKIVYICPLCEKQVPNLIKHHYSYFPEKTILVCQQCNLRNNLEMNHPLLNPPKEDADKFYGRNIHN